MTFQWDDDKAASNLLKHGVSFKSSETVFNDLHVTIEADDYEEEERFSALGLNSFGDLLIVIHQWKDDNTIRIISARKASPRERRQYEQ